MKRLTIFATFAFSLVLIVVALPHFVRADFSCCYTDQDLSLVVGDVLIEGPVGLFDNFAGEIPPPVVVNGDTLSSPSQSITINFLERPHRDRPLQIVQAFDVSVPKERGVYLLHRIPNDPTPENGPEGDILIPGTFSLVHAPVPANDGNIDTLESATITFLDVPALGDPAALSGRYLLSVFQLPETKYVYDAVFDDYIEAPYTEADLLAWYEWQFLDYDFYDDDIPEYADYAPDAEAVFTIDEYIGATTIEPTGASSVLFLPGIMGSHLYEDSDVCLGDGEQRRWFSIFDCDQRRLFTDSAGVSINDIYTKSGPDAIAKETLGINLYKSFMAEMDKLAKQGIIADFTPLPYDWRLRLDDILKLKLDSDTQIVHFDSSTPLTESYIYKTVEAMVERSLSGKVSIVAHSNGGLLAKVFLNALEEANDPLLDKIDNLILVGAPQAGTPDAVVGMLHGSPILHGVVVNGDTSRELLNTAPFGHHLLPNEIYFAGDGVEVNTPIITIADGEVTSAWKDQFGSKIQSLSSLQTFLKADSGRSKPAFKDLLHPEVVDGNLLDYANQIAGVQASWQPAESIKVYQIAGTGVETVTGLTYFTDYECVRSNLLVFGCTEYQPKLGYRVNHTYDGDETVVVPSALAMAESEGVERWWVNLFEYGDNNFFDVKHKNLLELDEIQDFIKSTVLSTTHQTYNYLFDNPITPDIGDRLEFQLHSPLDMFVEAPDGVVSSSTVTIPGAVYRRYGEVQYISLPLPITGHTLLLQGDAPGSFNLEAKKRGSGGIVDQVSYSAVPNLDSTAVSVSLDDFSASTTLSIDFDGDGEVDGVVEAVVESPAILVTTPQEVETEVIPSPGGGYSRRHLKSSPEGLVAGVSTTMTQEELYLWKLIELLEELKRLLILLNNKYETN